MELNCRFVTFATCLSTTEKLGAGSTSPTIVTHEGKLLFGVFWNYFKMSSSRRQFCTTCKTFPFKTEVHKCPGPAEVLAKKTLEELAREVEAGVVDPEDLAPQKHLGNIAVWQCPVCPKSFPSLSLWLDHLISDHFGKNSDKLVFSLKCFCCTWKPLKAAQMDRGNEALAVEQLVGHLLAEHNHHLWSDPDCERELRRVARAAKEHQKLQEREKEEAAIVVPKLPAPSPTGVGECLTAEEWKYHTLALKYGEVFCAGCHKCFIGYKFRGHKARCRELPPGVDRVEVVQETKDTWVEVAGRKARVFFEYRWLAVKTFPNFFFIEIAGLENVALWRGL